MNIFKSMVAIVFVTLCFSSVFVKAQTVRWDFESGNKDGFTLWSAKPATPAPEDTTIAGDEAVTGAGGSNGLPSAGVAWSVGSPNQYDGQKPAVAEAGDCHINADGVLEYSICNDPFHVFDPGYPEYMNSRGQSSYLNTYALSQWGDALHDAANDQIASSPVVELSDNAMLIVWAEGGDAGRGAIAPEPDANWKTDRYKDGSHGIAVLSAADSSFLTSVLVSNKKTLTADTLDLSAYAGQKVIIEAVDAFTAGWGFFAVDEIDISNARVVSPSAGIQWTFESGNKDGFTLWSAKTCYTCSRRYHHCR